MNYYNHNYYTFFAFIFFFGLLSYLMDLLSSEKGYYKKNDRCLYNPYFHGKLLLHHIIVIFIFFGWLSNDQYILFIYAFVPFILITHWNTNQNRCAMTETVNKMCDLGQDEYIRDFVYMIGLKKSKYYDTIYRSFLFFSFSVVIYKLYKLYRIHTKII